jgi:hypothetical protein
MGEKTLNIFTEDITYIMYIWFIVYQWFVHFAIVMIVKIRFDLYFVIVS